MLHELEGLTAVTVDPADPPSGRSDQCYTAAVSAKHTNRGLFVLRYRRGRYTDAEIIKHTFDIADIDDADIIRIEADRYPHLANAFRMEMARRNKVYAIEEVKTRGRSKDARIMRIAAHAENGLIWLRKGMDELETELYQYPLGSTNDIIDALAWHITDFEPLPDIKAYKRPQDAHNYREVSYEHLVEKLNHRPRQSRFYRN